MKDILQSFKKLYQGQDVVKRHFLFLTLFILPAIAGCFAGYVDKETPATVIGICLIASLIFLILSIIPGFMMTGFALEYAKSRLNGDVGIPKLSWEHFVRGVKVFPLNFVWFIYAMFLVTVLFILPMFGLIYAMVTIKEPVTIGLGILTIILLYLALIALMFLLTPFTAYINLKYCEDYKLRAELFNPLIIIDFMKKAFKDSIILALKFIVATIVVSSASSIVTMCLSVFMFLSVFIVAIITGENEGTLYHLAVIASMMPMGIIITMISSYTGSMTGYAYVDRLAVIYKDKIREQ